VLGKLSSALLGFLLAKNSERFFWGCIFFTRQLPNTNITKQGIDFCQAVAYNVIIIGIF
jgi:hypothetical protein